MEREKSIWLYKGRDQCADGRVLHPDCIKANMLCFGFIRCYPWGKLSERYMVSLGIVFYNGM